MERRDFIRRAAGATFAAAAPGLPPGAAQAAGQRVLPNRVYGREISIVGAGGNLWIGLPQGDADTLVGWSLDHGVNYFDVGPDYGDAEERLGPALQGRRQGVFLACKKFQRDAPNAQDNLERSLRRLRTDHFDLYQLHGLTRVDELDEAMAPGGAMETLLRARERGQARYLGFSAHSEPVALRALETGLFDSLLFPVNAVCWLKGNLGFQVVSLAHERKVTCIALKAMAWRPLPEGAPNLRPKCFYEPVTDPYFARLALGFALDLPIASLLPPGDEELFKQAVDIALNSRPLTDGEKTALYWWAQGAEPIFRR